ncbi:MAG: hypothetical protein AB7G35_08325 [Hyphomicrobiaceae bacterium]
MIGSRWHYPRVEFAERVHDVLAGGATHALSMFGPRRTGKSQFLTHDLAPLAEARGHKVVYVDLCQMLESPLGILLYELDRTLRSGSLWSNVTAAARDIAPKFTLKVPGGAGEMEIDLADLRGKAPESHLLLLNRYCARLAKTRKPAFLLLDEFQELARNPGGAALVAALRTSLDRHRDGIVSVFTGSSQQGLRAMFTARDAPFFRFATPVELPPLDERFVDHQLKAFRTASKARVARTSAMDVFQRFDRNPMFFRRWLAEIALHPGMSEADAIVRVQAQFAEEFGFSAQWLALSSVQRVVARLLAERTDQIYGQAGGQRIEALTGRRPPDSSAIQSALKRLSRLRLADKWDEVWRLNDPIFEAWVRDRPDSDF